MLDDYTRAQVNRAVEDALRPSGMSVHSGRASIDAGVLQRPIVMIDRGTEASLEALDQIAVLDVENARLRTALAKANSQTERVEREWYLRGDEIEQLRAAAERYRWLRGGPDVPSSSSRWPRWEVRYWDGRYWQTMFAEDLDATLDAAMKEQK